MSSSSPADLPRLPAREPDSHKGTYGRGLIVAGSRLMPGAARLAARAAMRAGLGLGKILTGEEAIPAIAPGVPECTFWDWSEVGRRLALDEALGQDAILVGPGLGETGPARLVEDLLRAHDGPTVLDADALNWIARGDLVVEPRDDRIYTPHPGEFERLTGSRPVTDEERLEAGRRFVGERGGVLVLKGHRTLVIGPDVKRHALNTTGNAGLATAGSGDVLSGILLALLAQGLEAHDAARLGCHLHGLAGDLAARELGEISLIAPDLLDYLSAALKRLREETS